MRIYYLFFLLIILPSLLFSQINKTQSEGTIRGFVYEESTSEPIIYANVSILNTNFGASTDDNGYFIFPKVPSGNYTIQVSFMGFQTKSINIELKNGKMFTLEKNQIFEKTY